MTLSLSGADDDDEDDGAAPRITVEFCPSE